MLLARDVESEVRNLFAQTGWITQNRNMTMSRMMQEAEDRHLVSVGLTSSVRVFWDIRDAVVHAHKPVPEAEILQAIDIGMTVLKMLEGIPHEVHVIYRPGVVLYRDAAASEPYEGIKGLLLKSTSPGGTQIMKRIFPTTRTDYLEGQRVGWEWNLSRVCGDAWYRDPDDDQVRLAWNGAAEFIGDPLLSTD